MDGEDSSNFDEDYNADALPIKFKVIDIIPPKELKDEKLINNGNSKDAKGPIMMKVDCRGDKEKSAPSSKEIKSMA